MIRERETSRDREVKAKRRRGEKTSEGRMRSNRERIKEARQVLDR